MFNRSNVGIAESLTAIFILLKLAGFIEWPWFWILSPMWISFLCVLIIAALLVILAELRDFK